MDGHPENSVRVNQSEYDSLPVTETKQYRLSDQPCCSLGRLQVYRDSYVLLLVAFVGVIYLTKLAFLPAVGEEPRWGRGAAQMIETGDWIVLRQQGEVFPERPPMTPWSMAIVASLQGKLDVIAVRLPSVIGVLLTSLMIFGYARCFTSRHGAFFAALAYASFFQVLQLGRHGESEGLFTFFLSSALLLWHAGYTFTDRKSWGRVLVWAIGFGFAGCAALAKGPQGPAYFIAAAGFYTLIVQRDWRSLFDWRPFLGACSFLIIVGSWQVPYLLMTDMQAVKDTWFGLAGDRFSVNGLIQHMVEYPIAIMICLLPWSPLLALLLMPSLWRRFQAAKPMVQFSLTAILITFPTVWFAAAAQERYFMPLYPCFAVLVGVIMEKSIQAATATRLAKLWKAQAWLGVATSIALAIGIVVVWVTSNDVEIKAALTPTTVAVVALLGCLAALVQTWSTLRGGQTRAGAGALSLALLVGSLYVGPVMNLQRYQFSDPASEIASIREQIDHPEALVSLGAINARFAFYYGDSIEQREWPLSMSDVPEDLEYFVIMRYPCYEDGQHMVGRGRYFKPVPVDLPFEWEPVGDICCDRKKDPNPPQQRAIVGRVIRINDRIAERKSNDRDSDLKIR